MATLFGKLFEGLGSAFIDFNSSTLSGAIDIVVVKNPQGKYVCTPFHVRFGKLRLLRSKEKYVSLAINGKTVPYPMKLGPAGEAFFVEECTEELNEPDWSTSPLYFSLSDNESEVIRGDDFTLGKSAYEESTKKGEERLKSPELKYNGDGQKTPKAEEWTWGWGSLPKRDKEEEKSRPIPILSDPPRISKKVEDSFTLRQPTPIAKNKEGGSWVSSIFSGIWGQSEQKTNSQPLLERESIEKRPRSSSFSLYDIPDSTSIHERHSCDDLCMHYLQDTYIADFNKEESVKDIEPDNYLVEKDKDMSPIPKDKDISPIPKLSDSISSINLFSPKIPSDLSNYTFELPSYIKSLQGIELSLSSSYLTPIPEINMKKFDDHLITLEQIQQFPTLIFSPELVIRVNNQIYPREIAIPMIMSLAIYQKPLNYDNFDNPKALWSWMNIEYDKNNINQNKSSSFIKSPENSPRLEEPPAMISNSKSEPVGEKKYRKQLEPSSEMLESLNLKLGRNSISFTVRSKLQGTQSISASIYLWSWNSRIVVSDIDGTITRSDFFGNIMPLMGKDWSHQGVASLFSAINKNGYNFLYLTARAIGQAQITRSCIEAIKQDDIQLPDGPIFLSPESLMRSFKREIIDRRPQDFKVIALRNLKQLFNEDSNPFYAGFGNRLSDNDAYKNIGVPSHRIFIINTSGEIENIMCNSFKTSYPQLYQQIDQLFPPVATIRPETNDFNEFTFWNKQDYLEIYVDSESEDENAIK